VSDHLRADLAAISQVSQTLGILGNEFSNITKVADVGGASGDSGLAAALSDFANDWSDKRTALIGQMQELAKLAGQAVQEYRKTDTTLTHALTEPATGGRERS
jgi:hypothetical protein